MNNTVASKKVTAAAIALSVLAAAMLTALLASTPRPATAQAATPYKVEELVLPAMTRDQGFSPEPTGINDSGVVVGLAKTPPTSLFGARSYPALWSGGEVEFLIPNLNRPATALGLNNKGQAAGWVDLGVNLRVSIVYENGIARPLEDLEDPNLRTSEAFAINDAGQVVGSSDNRAVLYEANGTKKYLGTLPGGAFSYATALNEKGKIVGVSQTEDAASSTSPNHAFLYENGQMRDLGTLSGDTGSSAHAVNEAGQVVGESYDAAGAGRAFLYENGQIKDLGTLPGKNSSRALAINDAGQVVGSSDSTAFLYEGGQIKNLNAFLPAGSGWQLFQAVGINSKGQIVGLGTRNGQPGAFLMTPPPDTTAPETTITAGTSGTTNGSATFSFGSTEPGSTFRCSLDGGAYVPCSSPKAYSGLAGGAHVFLVAAVDRAGNADPTPAVRSFAVDVLRPGVISTSPTGKRVSPSANVTATFSETMQAASVNRTTVRLVKRGARTPVAASVTYSATTGRATLNPSKSLVRGATYTATVTTGVRDLVGNPLVQTRTWTFTVRK